MDTDCIIKNIVSKEFNISEFVNICINEIEARETIIKEMILNENIMVYYHCFYVIDEASKNRPELFYSYWSKIESLLNHKNSYHRNFSLTIIANLTQVDTNKYFEKIYDKYFEHINDEKFMTAECCLVNSKKIINNKRYLTERIIETIIEKINKSKYTEKQIALLKSKVIDIFEIGFQEIKDKGRIISYVQNEVNSKSPKTRKRAKMFLSICSTTKNGLTIASHHKVMPST